MENDEIDYEHGPETKELNIKLFDFFYLSNDDSYNSEAVELLEKLLTSKRDAENVFGQIFEILEDGEEADYDKLTKALILTLKIFSNKSKGLKIFETVIANNISKFDEFLEKAKRRENEKEICEISSLCDQIKIIIEEYKQKVNVKVIDMPRLSIRVRKSIKHSEECISILIGVVNEDQNNIKRLSKRISLLDRDKKNLILQKFSEEYEKNTENGYYEYDHVISENENVYQTENTHKDNSIDESFEVINEYYVVDKIDDSTNNQIIPKQFEAKKLSIDALNSKEDGLNILSSIERFENNFSVRKSLKLIKENENNKLNIIEDNTYYDEDEIEHTNIIYFENSKDHTKEISFISINLLMKIFMEASEKSEKYKIDNNILKGFILQKSGIITTNNFIELMYSICKLIASHSLDSKLVNGLGIIFINWIYYRYEDEIFGNDEIIDKMINFLEKLETLTPIINFKLKSIEIKTLLTILKSEQIKPIDNYDLGNISIIRFISVMKIKKLLDLDQTYDLSNKFISSIFSSTERILPVTMKEYFDVTQWSEIEVARQITLITHFIFCSIHPKELINSKWTKHNKYTESPNVTKIIERFNKISAWICEEILAYDKARLRAGAIEKFILIAKELRNINNFNDAFAVIIALNSFHIKSLKKSWNKVSLERLVIFKELEELFSYSRNFFHLREEISKVESEPCIPYFGYFLKELAFLDEGPKYLKEKNMVNIEKIKKVQKVLDNISKYQSFIYRYKPIYKLSFLADPSPLNEDQLTDISERLEPFFNLSARKSKSKRLTNTDLTNLNINQTFKEFMTFYHRYTFNITLRDKIKSLSD